MRFLSLIIAIAVLCSWTHSQDNYEIQVYPSETVEAKVTMVELHSNFTFDGSTAFTDGVRPTEDALHETVEITHGVVPNLEIGWYIFTSSKSGYGPQWVGDHIRPRVSAPAEWHIPVGLSLSAEIGYQRPEYSPDTWTIELRPIIDDSIGNLYVSFNPSTDISLKGANQSRGLEFEPNLKIGYNFSDLVNAGVEYYGALGPVTGFDPANEQEQQIFPAVDLNFSPEWEFNFGVGWGLTPATDHFIAK
ncbi:MAG TPA: transporter, partial [Bacteroidota bacterium]|nr:transporter [Bacteroidota bacterium]